MIMSMSIDVPAYRAGDIVRATGVTHRSLKAWNEERVIIARTRGTGDHRRYSLRVAHRIALAQALVRCGIRPRVAIETSSAFSGESFPTGQTYLVCLPGSVGRIVNADSISTIADALANSSTGEKNLAAAIVDVGAVVANTNERLNIWK
jgi:hypothetical protein